MSTGSARRSSVTVKLPTEICGTASAGLVGLSPAVNVSRISRPSQS